MSEAGAPRHIAMEQVRLMVDFMCQHVDLACGRLRTLEARHQSKVLWEELAALLNECSGGVRKTGDGWNKYWSDWKNKLKKRAQLSKKKGPDSIRLTKLDKRALAILGPGFDKKKRSFSSASYDSSYSNDPPPVIKLELDDDDSTNLSGDEQTSDVNSDFKNDEDVNDSDQNANDPLQNIYPKWLIDVEKKRADAELLRAKAEEQRASVAARTADAALIQANALKKLAEATSNQAEALMRIALVLEARGERDILAL